MGILTKYKTFILWLSTYIIVFMVPFGFIIFNYFYSINIIRTESTLSKKTSHVQLGSIIDQKISEIEKIANQLIWDRQIRLYLKSGDYDESYRLQIENKIKELRFLNDFIYQIYIVNEKKEAASADRIIPENFQGANIDWEKIYSDRDRHVYLKDVDRLNEGEELYFITKFFMLEEGKSDQYLVIFLNREVLKQSFRQIGWIDRGSAYIIDSDGVIITSIVNIEPDVKIKQEYKSVLGSYSDYRDYFEIERDRHIASIIKSTVLDWYYIIVTTRSVYFGRILDFQRTVLNTLFMAMGAGILLSFLFTRKYYQQIRELRELFSGTNIQEIYKKYLDEFDILENEIKAVIRENINIKKTFTGSSIGTKKIFLRRLLTGEDIEESVLRDLGNFCGINFRFSGYCAIVASNPENSRDGFFRLESAIEAKSEELERKLNAYCVSYAGNSVIILNIDSDADAALLHAKLNKISETIREGSSDQQVMDCVISSGRVYGSVSEIPVSYSEALKVLEYKTLLGDKNILLFDSLKTLQKNSKFKYISFHENEYKIYNLLTAHKYGEARTLLSRDMDLVEEMYHDVGILKIRLAGFQNIIIESLNAVLKNEPDKLKYWARKTMESCSFPGLRRLFDTLIEELNAIMPDKNTATIALSAKKYIETNFMNKDLAITEIAEKLGITPQHLSKIFKQENGTGLLQYINQCRIEEAKTILENEDNINIKDTARIVGYYNEITFIRNFKSLTGISPGQYKFSSVKSENSKEIKK